MIHELLQITGSHNVEGTLIIPKDTGSAQTVTGSVAQQNGEIFIFNGQNWQTLGAQSGITQPDFSLSYLVVAAGGGGGGWGGGGGAGGMLTGSIDTVTSGSSFTMTVGAGGSAGTTAYSAGGDGGASSLAGSGYTTVSTVGGGGGGFYNGNDGRDGGSGGGGGIAESGTNNVTSGGSGTAGQGNDGGQGGGRSGVYYGGGGGGGAGQIGQNHVGQTRGGHGGSGSLSNITGTDTFYAGGGGGHTDRSGDTNVRALGGPGGGGDGGIYLSPHRSAEAGDANTGGGGGSATGAGASYDSYSAAGGSGIVIVSYDSGSLNGAGGIVGPGSGGKKSHSFLSTDTFKIGATTDFQIVTDNLKLHLDAGDFSSRGDSTWTDLTSTGYNATLVSSPALTNFYYEFDGSADYGTFSSTAATDLQNDTQGSIEVWVYGDSFTSGNARKTIFGTGHSSSTSNWVVLRVTNSNGIQMSVWDGSTSRDFKTGSVPSTGAWLHIVATATSDGTGKIYLNGVSQSISYYNGTAGDGSSRWFSHSSTNTLQVGALDRGSHGNNYDTWDGRIAQVRYYTDVLTDAEVLQNYNATKTNFS